LASGLAPTQRSQSSSLRQRSPLQPSLVGSANEQHETSLISAKKVEESNSKGYLSMLGGIMIHLTCGSMYCWGNLISYLPASLKYWSPSGGTGPADAQLVLAFILVSQMTGMPLGPVLEKVLGPRLTAVVGSVMMGAGVFLASYAKTLLQFVLSYSVLFGLGVGVTYQMPFLTGGRWFPTKKGTVQGAIISGMGASAFLFNMFGTNFINPTGMNMVNGAFPPEVTERWPSLLRTLGVTFFLLSLGGALLQSNPPSSEITYPAEEFIKKLTGHSKPEPVKRVAKTATAAAGPPAASTLSLVFSSRFAVLWLMILGSAVSGLNIASSYKTFGAKQPQLNSDSFLTAVGAVAAIGGNAAGRFFWGSASDKLGFKACFSALTLLQGLTIANFGNLAKTRATFLLGTVFMLFCMGGNFAMFPAQTFRTFGAQGADVYSFLFTGFGCAALLGPLLTTALLQKGGYRLVYMVLSLMSAFSFTLCRVCL